MQIFLCLFLLPLLLQKVLVSSSSEASCARVPYGLDWVTSKVITLENKIRVLVVSDPKADISSAAIDIGVGIQFS